jgi:hypothetical protein
MMESLSDKNKIWQLEELALILFASGRFHHAIDIVLLSEIFERLVPKQNMIGFNANKTFISRQIELLKKNEYVITVGFNISISAKGRAFALRIINEKIHGNEELLGKWNLYRKILWRLPRDRDMWDGYLEEYLKRLNK